MITQNTAILRAGVPVFITQLACLSEATGRTPNEAAACIVVGSILVATATITVYAAGIMLLNKPPAIVGFQIVRAKRIHPGDTIMLNNETVKVSGTLKATTPFGYMLRVFIAGRRDPELVRMNDWVYRKNTV